LLLASVAASRRLQVAARRLDFTRSSRRATTASGPKGGSQLGVRYVSQTENERALPEVHLFTRRTEGVSLRKKVAYIIDVPIPKSVSIPSVVDKRSTGKMFEDGFEVMTRFNMTA
jgi:hypothetical protein